MIVWLMTALFFVLKLAEVIDWSWFWVFSPLVFGYGLAALLLVATTFAKSGRS